MILESRKIIHMGINYVTLPSFPVTREKSLQLQQTLLSRGVEFANCGFQENVVTIKRPDPFALEARFATLVTSPRPLGQVLILGKGRQWTLASFGSELCAIQDALDETWSLQRVQTLSCDVTVRCLYRSDGAHAFKELWENRLAQPEDRLQVLGRKVLGGGLRLVMPPVDDPHAAQIELKVESFLQDTKQVFVEVQFTWPQPQAPGTMDPTSRLNEVNDFVVNRVHSFLSQEEEKR